MLIFQSRRLAIHILVVRFLALFFDKNVFQLLGLLGPMKVIAVSVVMEAVYYKSELANTRERLRLVVLATKEKFLDVILNHVVSFGRKISFRAFPRRLSAPRFVKQSII